MEVIQKFIDVVESLGFPLHLQGTIGEYENNFFTWWNNSTNSNGHYDNDEHAIIYDFDLNAYSIDPKTPYEMLENAKALLKQNGFTVSGVGYSVASDEPTHTGRGINILFVDWGK
jgi:hypothetical protein